MKVLKKRLHNKIREPYEKKERKSLEILKKKVHY